MKMFALVSQKINETFFLQRIDAVRKLYCPTLNGSKSKLLKPLMRIKTVHTDSMQDLSLYTESEVGICWFNKIISIFGQICPYDLV